MCDCANRSALEGYFACAKVSFSNMHLHVCANGSNHWEVMKSARLHAPPQTHHSVQELARARPQTRRAEIYDNTSVFDHRPMASHVA